MESNDRGFELAHLIDEAYHTVNVAIAEGLTRAGHPAIRPAHAAVFELLGDGAHVSQLARGAGMTKQAMAELVAHLERHGYVRREPNPDDRRTAVVILTEQGHEAAGAARAVLSRIVASWEQSLGTRRIGELHRGLAALVAAVRLDPASG